MPAPPAESDPEVSASDVPPSPFKRPSSLTTWSAERLCRLLLLAACLPPVGWVAGSASWIVDLLSHFPLQAAAGAFVSALVFASLRRWKFFAAAVVILVVNVSPMIVLFVPAPQPDCRGPTVRICAVNIFVDNLDGDRVLNVIRGENPDIVYVSELNIVVDRALRKSGLFPHVYARATEDSPWGSGFYSRWPIRNPKLLTSEYGCPNMVVEVDIHGAALTLVGAHPPPPAGGRFTALRNRSLDQAAGWIAGAAGPVVLCGDLNTTPWSHAFRDLVRVSGLRDARRGYGLQLTWPTHLFPFRIPIDHVLVSADIAVRSHRIAEKTGSDHFPVVVDVQLPGSSPSEKTQPSDSAMR